MDRAGVHRFGRSRGKLPTASEVGTEDAPTDREKLRESMEADKQAWRKRAAEMGKRLNSRDPDSDSDKSQTPWISAGRACTTYEAETRRNYGVFMRFETTGNAFTEDGELLDNDTITIRYRIMPIAVSEFQRTAEDDALEEDGVHLFSKSPAEFIADTERVEGDYLLITDPEMTESRYFDAMLSSLEGALELAEEALGEPARAMAWMQREVAVEAIRV